MSLSRIAKCNPSAPAQFVVSAYVHMTTAKLKLGYASGGDGSISFLRANDGQTGWTGKRGQAETTLFAALQYLLRYRGRVSRGRRERCKRGGKLLWVVFT